MIGKWLLFVYMHRLAPAQLPLAALISLDTLRNILSTLGYPAVALFIMIESAGIPFPGETMLLLAAFYAAIDHTLQIPIVIACAALGAIIGDNIGYLIGKTGGYALVRRFGHYVFLKEKHLQAAENFFRKHGNKTVFFGRFVAVLRAWAAFLAGVNRMPWSTFLLYNAAGGILWATIFGCLGFYAGHVLHENFDAVERLARTVGWTGAALIIAAALIVFILFHLRRKYQRQEATRQTEQNTSLESAIPASLVLPETPEQQPEVKESSSSITPLPASDPQQEPGNPPEEARGPASSPEKA